VNGTELWKSDGTESGTVLVKDIRSGSATSFPRYLTNVNGKLFFTADDGINGTELWKSDGTESGTVMVRNIRNGAATSFPRFLTNVNGTLHFNANDGINGAELWSSNGTTAGTTLVDDIRPGAPESFPRYLTNVDGNLFFRADDGVSGGELWQSDGTAAGTTLVRDIRPGSHASLPEDLINVNGQLYFSADDGVQGREVWSSDGTALGTVAVTSPDGSRGGYDVRQLVEFQDRAWINALTAETGAELFQTLETPQLAMPGATTQSQRPQFTWNPVPGATEYDIWIANQSTGTNPFVTATVATNHYTPASDFGIGKFNVWVRAKNATLTGRWSSQTNVVIDTQLQTHTLATQQTTHRPQLSWDSLPGAARYDLWVNDTANGVSQFLRQTDITATSWSPSFDLPLGLYTAWVRGIAEDGTSGHWSTAMRFYVVPPPVMTQGMNSTFDRTPTFAWQSLPGAVNYEVFIRDRNSGSTTAHQTGLTGLSWTPSSALSDGPYRVWVLGISAQNIRSQWTDPMDIFVGGRTEILTPQDSIEDPTPEFTWRPVDGAVRYDLWVDQVSGTAQIIRQQNLTSTSFTPGSPLPTGSSYRVWVRAIDSTGEISPWSLTIDFQLASHAPVDPSPAGTISSDALNVLAAVLPADDLNPIADTTEIDAAFATWVRDDAEQSRVTRLMRHLDKFGNRHSRTAVVSRTTAIDSQNTASERAQSWELGIDHAIELLLEHSTPLITGKTSG